jgi:hypothetical protein
LSPESLYTEPSSEISGEVHVNRLLLFSTWQGQLWRLWSDEALLLSSM